MTVLLRVVRGTVATAFMSAGLALSAGAQGIPMVTSAKAAANKAAAASNAQTAAMQNTSAASPANTAKQSTTPSTTTTSVTPVRTTTVTGFSAAPQAPQVEWHGVQLHAPDWSHESRSLAMHLHGQPNRRQDHIYVIANAHWEAHEFELPVLPGWEWIRVVDTSRDAPFDIADPNGPEKVSDPRQYTAGPRSVVVLEGRESGKSPSAPPSETSPGGTPHPN